MNPFVWITDPHLNHVGATEVEAFFDEVRSRDPQAIWITGDFSESTHLVGFLNAFEDGFDCPIYFVLGNHDFYFGSIQRIREEVNALCRSATRLHYLTESVPIALNSDIALIGDDGWADGRIGDFERSLVMMHDYKLIKELNGLSKFDRWKLLQVLGDAAAERVRNALVLALPMAQHVVLMTHIPPMREACWHEGRISDDEWAPHFTCKAVGDTIIELMSENPSQTLTVLCGHTHSPGVYQPLPNVTVYTGAAKYGSPSITGVFDEQAQRIE